MRRFVAAQALKDLVGSAPVRKPKRTEPEKEAVRRKGKGLPVNPWRRSVDFRFPAPAEGRPVTAAGGSTFHCRMTPLSKARPADTAGRKDAGGSVNGAARHDLYVSDGRTIVQLDAASVDRYIADDEIAMSPHEPAPAYGSRVALLLSNISADAATRTAFWDERWQAASMPGDPVIELRPQYGSAEQWATLLADETLPDGLRRRLAEALAEATGIVADDAGDAVKARPSAARKVRLETDAEKAWAEGLAGRFRARGKSKHEIMIHYRRPRSGLVQLRFEFELPTGLSRPEVERIARSTATIFEGVGLPHTLAVHRPDALNDPRNWHIHVVAYPGRGQRMADGSWRFPRGVAGVGKIRPGDIAIALGDQGAKSATIPYRQRAERDLGQLRHAYAGICNRVLREGGHSRSFDARTYEEMGIWRDAGEHLGSSEARLVGAGVSTETDGRNMVRSWRGELADAMTAVTERFTPMKDAISTDIASVNGAGGTTPDARRLLARQLELDRWLEDLRAGVKRLARFDLHARMARSAASRSVRNTERLMQAIFANEASKADVANLPYILARRRLAQGHLAEVDAALDPWAADVEAFRAMISRDTEALRAAIEQWRGEARALPAIRVVITPEDPLTEPLTKRPTVPAATLEKPIPRTPTPAAVPAVPGLTLTHVFDRIRREDLHVDRIVQDGRSGHDVLGLTDEEAVLITDIRHADRVTKALDAFASNQERRIGHLVRLIRVQGWDGVANGVRQGTQDPNADAVQLARYRDHPLLLRELAALVSAGDVAEGIPADVAPPIEAAAPAPVSDAQPAIASLSIPPTEVTIVSVEELTPVVTLASMHDQNPAPVASRDGMAMPPIPERSTPDPSPLGSGRPDDADAVATDIVDMATDEQTRPPTTIAEPSMVRDQGDEVDGAKTEPPAPNTLSPKEGLHDAVEALAPAGRSTGGTPGAVDIARAAATAKPRSDADDGIGIAGTTGREGRPSPGSIARTGPSADNAGRVLEGKSDGNRQSVSKTVRPMRPTPAAPPIPPGDPAADRKPRRKVTIDAAVAQICRPAGTGGASEKVRAPLRPWIRKIGEEIAAGRMSLSLDGTTIIAGGVMAEPMTWLDQVGGLKGGYQALRLMAEAVQTFGSEPGPERYGRRIEPNDGSVASARVERGPKK